MKNILVTIDFSDVSINALEFAINMAQTMKSKITLFHAEQPILIVNDMGGFVYPETLEENALIELNKKMDNLIALVESHRIDASKIIRKGFLKDYIATVSEDNKIDLIVTGTHGAKGFEALFFGTNSYDIVEYVNCPVLIIPQKAKFTKIKKIMYATDIQYGDLVEIEKLSTLAECFEAQIIITHINEDSKTISEETENMEWFSEIGNSKIHFHNLLYKTLHSEDVNEALENAIEELEIDLICMSVSEKGFFKRLVSKSNTKEMAFHSIIPFMVFHLQ